MPKTQSTVKKLLKPPALKPGDKIGLVCPGSRPHNPSAINRSVKIVEEMGFVPVVGKHVLSVHGFMAGTDEERLSDLQGFFDNEEIQGIFAVTGGYGSLHLVDQLDYSNLTKHPKLLIGSDDNCAWLLSALVSTGLVFFHAPNLDSIKSKEQLQRIKSVLTSNKAPAAVSTISDGDPFSSVYAPVTGSVSGRLLGGNLTALVSLMGTKFEVDLSNAVLFLEDRSEANNILDRWFTNLYVSGQLKRAKGVAFGQFPDCGNKGSYTLLSLEDSLGDRIKHLDLPGCFGFPIGQTDKCAAVPVGIQSTLNAGKGILSFEEPALE